MESGHLLRLSGLLSVFLLCASTGTISGHAETAWNRWLDQVVHRELFDQMCRLLDLTEQQTKIAASLYGEYRSRIDVVSTALTENVSDLERQIREVDKARRAADGTLTESSLRGELMQSFLLRVAQANREADVVLEQWFDELELLLTDAQKARFSSVPRLVRRYNFNARASGSNFADVLRVVDVSRLVDEASAEDGELQFIVTMDDQSSEDTSPNRQLQLILHDYEIALDAIIAERLAETRDLSPTMDGGKVYDLGNPDQETRQWMRESATRWARTYNINSSTADRIAFLIEQASGLDDRYAWEDRFRAAYAPQLMARQFIDSIPAFINRRNEIAQDTRTAAIAIYEEYCMKRRQLRAEAFQTAVRNVRDTGFPWASSNGSPVYSESLEVLSEHQEDALKRIANVLGPPWADEVLSKWKQARQTPIDASMPVLD